MIIYRFILNLLQIIGGNKMYVMNYDFNTVIKKNAKEKISKIPAIFSNLLNKEFPKQEEVVEYNDYIFLGGYEDFMKESPNRLIYVLDMSYKDLEEVDADNYEDLTNIYGEKFKVYFEDVTNCLKKTYGEPHYIVNGFQNPIEHIEFDENLFACDDSITSYWVIDDKIGFVQFNWGFSDTEFQIGVSLGVTKELK